MTDFIRSIGPGDIGWIIAHHGSTYSEEFNFDFDFEVDIARKAVLLYDKRDLFTRIWIKEVDGENAGSIAISKLGDGLAFINFLLVIKAFRGRGIARELLEVALHHAEKNGFDRVRLETYSCLKKARHLYASRGFRISAPVRNLNKYGQQFEQEFWELNLGTSTA